MILTFQNSNIYEFLMKVELSRGTSDGSTFMVLNLRAIRYEFLLYKSSFFADYFLSAKNSDRQEVA